MVEPDLVDDDARRLDSEPRRELPLEPDRDVAEADRAMALVEQRPRDDPDRVREVDDPGVGRLAHALGDLEHDRHGAQRLGKPAGAGRLLADAAARRAERLVGEPRLLAADADLDEHEVGAGNRGVEVVGDVDRPAVPLPVEHADGEAADDGAPLGIDVVQHELRDVEARQPGDELRRVRRPAADDGDLHPFTPVRVTPSTNARCARKKRMITGAITSSVAAIVRFHCTWCSDRNCERPIERTQLCGFSPT